MGTRVRREAGSCTGRGFSAVDPDGYLAKFMSFATRPNVHGATQTITAIDHTTNLFTIVGHGLSTGDSVVLTVSGGSLPAEFTATTSLAYPLQRINITEYFFIKISNDTFKLATTHANAIAGTVIDFTSNGSGTISLTKLGGGANWYLHDDFSHMEAKTFTSTDVNTSTEVVTITGHGFSNIHKVTFSSSGTLPSPLVAGTAYWIYVINANSFYVYSDEADASVGGTGYRVNFTNGGSGTHTITTAEHFIVVTDTLNPAVNDYNTSPAGVAPKFFKFGYVNSESGFVRAQGYLWWDKTTHVGQQIWCGYKTKTYDSALFAYQFIGGDEFLFYSPLLGDTWYQFFVDTFTGIASKLEAITKVGISQSGVTAGSSVVLQLGTGQASNFTKDKYYYIYDFSNRHSWINYVKVTARDTGADTITVDILGKNFPSGSVITPYAHRYYAFGTMEASSSDINIMLTDYYNQTTPVALPYCSGASEVTVAHQQTANINLRTGFKDFAYNNDIYLNREAPDDEGYYDCMRHIIDDYYNASNATTSMNRIYGKSNNILKTKRGTMGQMSNTRTLNSVDYLYYYPIASYTYCDMITYSESDT